MTSLTRLRRLIEAARGVAAEPAIVPLLEASTGLSREGVKLGLSSHLETSPTDDELTALVAKAVPAEHVHIVLSANVFTAPLRALAVAVAAAPSVSVRPSRRDPVFTRALVARLGDERVRLDEDARVEALAAGEVHVYGRDETVAAVARAVRAGVVVRAHGAGMGVALVTERVDEVEAARAVGNDVIAFDQRGCLSPRVVLVLGDAARGERFAAALHIRLAELEAAVPRGRLDPEELRDAARYRETMAFAGAVHCGVAHAVGLSVDGALVVPPTGRHVHVAVAPGVSAAQPLLEPLARQVVALGSDSCDEAGALLPSGARARISLLGYMQRPPLDGPVDLR